MTTKSGVDGRPGGPAVGGGLGLRAAPWLLWFGVFGGAVAWSLHTVVDWSIDETTCRSGHSSIGSIPLFPLLLSISLFFLLVTAASTVVSWRHWRRTSAADELHGLTALRNDRVHLMALVGLVMNVFFLMMVAFGAIDVLVFPVCEGPVAL